MKEVYVKTASAKATKMNQINYLHVFTGARKNSGMIVAEKSLVRIGKKGAYFTEPGDEIFLGKLVEPRDYQEVVEEIIESIFESYIDIEQVKVHG